MKKLNQNNQRTFCQYAITLLALIFLNFTLPRLMPGDAFLQLSTDESDIAVVYSDEQIAEARAYYGLDKPWHEQFYQYFGNIFQGNMGKSLYYKQDVLTLVLDRAKWTVGITLCSLIISSILGTLLGCISAYSRETPFDNVLYSIMIILSEIPSFLIGVVLLFFAAFNLKNLPLSGGVSNFAQSQDSWLKFLDIAKHAVLPLTSLVLVRIGDYYLIARNSMITTLSKQYMTVARAKGLSKNRIMFAYGLRNAFPPIATHIFMSLGGMLGGAILVENVFQYPGIGTLMNGAVRNRDYTLIQGLFLFTAILVLLFNFLSDISTRLLDPRTKG